MAAIFKQTKTENEINSELSVQLESILPVTLIPHFQGKDRNQAAHLLNNQMTPPLSPSSSSPPPPQSNE